MTQYQSLPPTIGWSKFAIDRHKKGTGNSFFTIWSAEVLDRVSKNWDKRTPGTGETGIDRKVLVSIDPTGFFISSTLELKDNYPISAEVVRRQAHEDPYIETYIDEAVAHALGIPYAPAKFCNIVCYSKEALLENDGERSTDCEWEIVAVLASLNNEVTMPPLTMARNFLELPGGTKSTYTAEEFAQAIYQNSVRGVRIKSSKPQTIVEVRNRIKQLQVVVGDLYSQLRDFQKNCQHVISEEAKQKAQSAICTLCGKDLGWACAASPVGYCEYEDEENYISENCKYCGEYEERK
jgi:hypothetical protein